MKKIYLFSCLSFFLLMSCDQKEQNESEYGTQNAADSTIVDSLMTSPTDSLEDQELDEKGDPEELNEFIPDGYKILAWHEGDLNRDSRKNDVILILDEIVEVKEDDYPVFNENPRPVLVLLRGATGKLREVARNDDVALCSACGGVFGDPYSGIAIKNGYFSIEHYGGSSWRWTRIMTFKYSDKNKTWYLHKDGGDYYHTAEPDDVETKVLSKKDFGTIKFEDYRSGDVPI